MSGFEQALKALSELAKQGDKPSHYAARHLLLELGALLEQGPHAESVERAQRAGEALGLPWRQAVEAELTLACGEFAQSVDPRYLSLPAYDVAYTRAARTRLGVRLRAAEALGFTLAPREVEVLALADQVWDAYLLRREGARDPIPPQTAVEGPPPGGKSGLR